MSWKKGVGFYLDSMPASKILTESSSFLIPNLHTLHIIHNTHVDIIVTGLLLNP